MSKLLVLRDGSALGRAITTPGHHFYLKSISKSGRTARYTLHAAQALQLYRAAWEKLKNKWPTQTKGRLVRVPPVTA